MKLLLGAAVIAVALVAIPKPYKSAMFGQQSSAAQNRSEEKVLIQLENAWGDAVSTRNRRELDRIIADDWTGRYPFDVLTKAQALQVIASGDLKVQSVKTSDLKVRLFGDIALVTGTDIDAGAYYRGRDVSGRYLWMDVFAKRAGRWQVVASEETIVMSK